MKNTHNKSFNFAHKKHGPDANKDSRPLTQPLGKKIIMENILKCLAVILFVTVIEGCYRPVDVVAALPISKQKTLKGTISNNTYLSMDHKFSVELPYASDSSEWKYMNAKDGKHGDDVSFVEFGPVVGPSLGKPYLDDNIYSVVYVKHPKDWDSSTFYEWSNKVFNNYTAGNAELVVIDKNEINGKKSVYAVYATKAYKKSYTVFTLIEHGTHATNFIVRVGNHHSGINENKLIDKKWDRFNKIVSSFKVINEKS